MGALPTHDSGQLRKDMIGAATQHGHGRLVRDDGETLDIGGSTGGGSRRIIDDWRAPDWRQFLGGEVDWASVGSQDFATLG